MKKAVTFNAVSLLILLNSFGIVGYQRPMEVVCSQNVSGNTFFSPFFLFKQTSNANRNLPHTGSNTALLKQPVHFCAPQTMAVNCITGSDRYTGFRIEPYNIQFNIVSRKKLHKIISLFKEIPLHNGFSFWKSIDNHGLSSQPNGYGFGQNRLLVNCA